MNIKLPYGSTAENDQLNLPAGMLSIDTERKAIRLFDGVTQGGFEVIGEQAFVPTPGSIWETARSTTDPIEDVCYGNGIWVAVTRTGKAWRSSNGTSWVPTTINSSYVFYAVVYHNGLFIAGGVQGVVYTSPDGSSWSKRNTGLDDYKNIVSLSSDGTTCVGIVSAGRCIRSTNGYTWTIDTQPVYSPLGGAFINSRFVSVGGGSGGNPGLISFSDDGDTWGSAIEPDGVKPFTATYGNGIYVAAGLNGGISTSEDGITWLQSPSASQTIMRVIYLGGQFIAVGSNQTILTSADGVVWVQRDCPIQSIQLESIATDGSRLVAVGTGGIITSF